VNDGRVMHRHRSKRHGLLPKLSVQPLAREMPHIIRWVSPAMAVKV